MKNKFRNTILFFASACISATQAAGVLDQQQLLYNGGLSARTLPGYAVWQSFTAGVSGRLSEIDMGFFNNMSGSGQLQILQGNGTTGAVLQTLTVPVVGITQPAVTWNAWAVSVPVQAGLQYTFKFTPNAATLPDPYGVAIGAGNPYSRGTGGVDDPSGSYPMSSDLVFRTFVTSVGTFVVNISTRGVVQTGDNVMIGGFIIQGGQQKVIIRAIGPSLTQYGVAGALQNPTLELHNAAGALIGRNDNWGTTVRGGVIMSDQVAEIQASGLAPGDSRESAIISTLQPGNYTAIIRGVNNTTGVALMEVYATQ